MANEEHLEILKQGVEAWNRWREENPEVRPYLRRADLTEAQLSGVNLHRADLSWANLGRANLNSANLREVNLIGANLVGASLRSTDLSQGHLESANFREADLVASSLYGANLYGADFHLSNLIGANLDSANLSSTDLRKARFDGVNFRQANLIKANLSRAGLYGAQFRRASLARADFTQALIGNTVFIDVDLSVVKGLDTIKHLSRSYIDIHTIYRSKDNMPEAFLRGAGAPDDFIEYARSLVGKAIEYYTCFISYSSRDQGFAERLHADLQDKGVRCWFAPEDMKIGDRIRPTLDQSVRMHDKLLIILSENSVESDWVEQEVETALARERQEKRTVLFPIRLDDAVMEIEVGWPALVRNTRHIGDFRHWEAHDAYQQAFGRLLRDLKAG